MGDRARLVANAEATGDEPILVSGDDGRIGWLLVVESVEIRRVVDPLGEVGPGSDAPLAPSPEAFEPLAAAAAAADAAALTGVFVKYEEMLRAGWGGIAIVGPAELSVDHCIQTRPRDRLQPIMP